ncbi:uncharacterized protein LOC142597944 [Dermatophagoides farinae]|uniref:uncharacterized protein LOC142597944 n=1 Tax=Dermatophagoides farinae TaxID=6954 RepID=UPI003F647DC5
MSSIVDEITLESATNFRGRIALAALTGRKLHLKNVHADDNISPGLRPHEAAILKLLQLVSEDIEIKVSANNTNVIINPGLLLGCKDKLVFECPTTRGISYYLEFLCMICYFFSFPLNIKLMGVTNHTLDPSVNSFFIAISSFQKRVNLPVLSVNVEARGLLPDGGGSVTVTCPVVKKIEPFTILNTGKIYKLRGSAFSCHVTKNFVVRMISQIREIFNHVLSDVYIYEDVCGKEKAGKSTGFGVELVAETFLGTMEK